MRSRVRSGSLKFISPQGRLFAGRKTWAHFRNLKAGLPSEGENPNSLAASFIDKPLASFVLRCISASFVAVSERRPWFGAGPARNARRTLDTTLESAFMSFAIFQFCKRQSINLHSFWRMVLLRHLPRYLA